MAECSFIEFEVSLATAVRNYLLAKQNDRISEDENLRPVCQWLARLLESLLRSADGWSQYAWVDDISPCIAERVLPNDLVFTGLLIWLGGSKSSEWKEPLFAALPPLWRFSCSTELSATPRRCGSRVGKMSIRFFP
jgi:hypothetical protein